MKVDQTIDRIVCRNLLAENREERKKHKPSGRLSASMMGKPAQEQVLKALKVSPRPIDQYAIRKFKRGNHVEKWLIKQMVGVLDKQIFVKYRDVVGYLDALVDTSSYEFKLGIMPHEIKSVSNAKYKYILRQGADRGHKLQAGLYALAKNSDYYAIDYVSTDDYRIHSLIYETKEIKKEIDDIIDFFNQAMQNKYIPVFEALESWHSNPKYQLYPDWVSLTSLELIIRAKELFKQYKIKGL